MEQGNDDTNNALNLTSVDLLAHHEQDQSVAIRCFTLTGTDLYGGKRKWFVTEEVLSGGGSGVSFGRSVDDRGSGSREGGE